MRSPPPSLQPDGPRANDDGLVPGLHHGSCRGTPGLVGVGTLAGPAAEGLASGLWAVPTWVVVGLGSAIIVGVIAFLAGRRLMRRRSP